MSTSENQPHENEEANLRQRGRRSKWRSHDHARARTPQPGKTLHRSRRRRVAGVAAGIAEFTGTRAATVRLIWLVSLPLSGGLTGLAYLAMWILLPPNRKA